MVRINLLPREIVERRKWERYYPIVFIVSGIALAVVLAIAVGLFLWVSSQRTILQTTQEQAQNLASQAEQFAVFEQKESALVARTTAAQTALSGRINWARVANDISLVLPDEVWLLTFNANQDTGLDFTANTPYFEPEASDEGYKSVAKTIVRLTALPDIYDVWLTAAATGTFSVGEGLEADIVSFAIKTKVVKPPPPSAPSTQAVPAPPSTPGQ